MKCPPVLQNEQSLLFDTMKTELQEKIRRLEEDRQNIDFNSGTNELVGLNNVLLLLFRLEYLCECESTDVGLLKWDVLFGSFGVASRLKHDRLYVLFSQSGVMIPEMTEARGRACLVSQRGRRR